MKRVQHTAIHIEVGLWRGRTAGREDGATMGGTATRAGQMLLFLAFVKSSKTLFPNTWRRPLILWVWGRMKESEGGRKGGRRDKWRENAVGSRMNLLHALLPWLLSIFTRCCHQATHPNWSPRERQTAAREQTLSHWSLWKKEKRPRCTVQQEAMMAAAKHVQRTPGTPLLRLLS